MLHLGCAALIALSIVIWIELRCLIRLEQSIAKDIKQVADWFNEESRHVDERR